LHDAICSNVALKLKNYDKVNSVLLDHHMAGNEKFHLYRDLDPDLIANIKGQIFGVEIELSQKISKRIYHKMEQYIKSQFLDGCIYIFPREGPARNYKKRLDELLIEGSNIKFSKHAYSKFSFAWNEKLMETNCNLIESRALYNGREVSLRDLIL
jgi:hypothetical protein